MGINGMVDRRPMQSGSRWGQTQTLLSQHRCRGTVIWSGVPSTCPLCKHNKATSSTTSITVFPTINLGQAYTASCRLSFLHSSHGLSVFINKNPWDRDGCVPFWFQCSFICKEKWLLQKKEVRGFFFQRRYDVCRKLLMKEKKTAVVAGCGHSDCFCPKSVCDAVCVFCLCGAFCRGL